MAFTKRHAVLVVLGVLGLVTAILPLLFSFWKTNADRGGQTPAEPFRIAGNLYYVGASDTSSFLVTNPGGLDGPGGPGSHVLIDAGFPGTAPLILASIQKLGFQIRDVKAILISEPHVDHAGGLAELQQASGAQVWASDATADVIASGGKDVDVVMPLRLFVAIGVMNYRPARVDHRVKDGDTVRAGPITLTAHITPGHTRGCTSWTFVVRDGNRELDVVSACSLSGADGMAYSDQRTDLERSARVLRSLPADIWVTSHARVWGRYRKFVESRTAKNPVDPFIDPDGYRAYIDHAEQNLRAGLVR